MIESGKSVSNTTLRVHTSKEIIETHVILNQRDIVLLFSTRISSGLEYKQKNKQQNAKKRENAYAYQIKLSRLCSRNINKTKIELSRNND